MLPVLPSDTHAIHGLMGPDPQRLTVDTDTDSDSGQWTPAADEPILRPSIERLGLFQVRYPDLFKFYKDAQKSFWIVEEIDLTQDVVDWDTLTKDERFFVSRVLAFFAASDGIVTENLAQRFMNDVQIPEARYFYASQIHIEAVHGEMYAQLIRSLIKDPSEQRELFHSVETCPGIAEKAKWCFNWIENDKRTFAERLIAFACVEGIFFSGSFAAVYWLGNRGVMPGLCDSNKFIARDEGLHRDFACTLLQYVRNRPVQPVVHTIVREAVDIEKGFLTESLPVALIGMNAGEMHKYIEFVADHLLQTMGYEPLYNAENPFTWMELIAVESRSNFFERRVTEYQRAGAMEAVRSKGEGSFDQNADF